MILTMLIFVICGCKQTGTTNGKEQKVSTDAFLRLDSADVSKVEEFYKPYIHSTFGEDKTAIRQFIIREVETLDSCYLIRYKQPINGYDIRMVVRAKCPDDQEVECLVNLFIAQGEKVICDTALIYFPDSVYNGLHTHTINELEYKEFYNEDYDTKYPCLGQFSAMPLVFFDIDFDGEKELLIRVKALGQRYRDCYSPMSIIWDSPCHIVIDDDFVYCGDIPKENYIFYPLDDMTQFDRDNKTIIFHLSIGRWDDEWHYFRVENGESKLVKKIVEYDRNAPKVMRITYQNNDTIITNIPVSKSNNSYSID